MAPKKRSKDQAALRFTVVAGVPEMQKEWKRLTDGMKAGTLSPSGRKIAKKLARAVQHLQEIHFIPGFRATRPML